MFRVIDYGFSEILAAQELVFYTSQTLSMVQVLGRGGYQVKQATL